MDDASRYALAGGEFKEATSEHSIETFKNAQAEAFDLNILIRHVNTDREHSFIPIRMKEHLNLRNISYHSPSGLFLQGGIIHKLTGSWNDSGTNMTSTGGGLAHCRIS